MNAQVPAVNDRLPEVNEMRLETGWVEVLPLASRTGANDANSKTQRVRAVDILALSMEESAGGF